MTVNSATPPMTTSSDEEYENEIQDLLDSMKRTVDNYLVLFRSVVALFLKPKSIQKGLSDILTDGKGKAKSSW